MREVAEGELDPYPGELWSERVAAAGTDDARRELITEVARWRAQHLDDGAAMRRATFAKSRLHAMVGENDRAVVEARQWMSLLQTATDATEEEVQAARSYLNRLGESAPRGPSVAKRARDWGARDSGARDGRDNGGPPGRRAPPNGSAPAGTAARGRGDRPATASPHASSARASSALAASGRAAGDDRRDGLADARKAAAREDYDTALGLIEGQRGSGAMLLRMFIQVSRAMASPDPVGALVPLRSELARAAAVPLPETSDPSDPLAQLLGGPVPAKRVARIRAIEAFAEAHPDQLDELAAAALRHHLATQGPGAPAPWLAGIVGAALAGGGERARSAIAELRAAESVAVLAYDEWPFERLVRLMKRAEVLGYTVSGLRRGVLARGEPEDRKIWTLRLAKDGVDGMISVAPHASAGYPPGMAEELGPRLRELCARVLLLASGFGNAPLRSAVTAVGGVVHEHDADDDALLASLAEVPVSRERRERADGPSLAGVPTDLAGVLTAEADPDPAAVVTVLRGFRRLDRALRIVQRLPLSDARAALVLQALAEVAEPGRRLPEAITFAVLAGSRGEQSRALVTGDGAAVRLVGAGLEPIMQVAASLLGSGWDVHRVLRGPTKRETSAHPALDTLSGAMSGLWRLLVRKGDRKGEVWYLDNLPIEGRAGVPLLLLEDWQRVVVLPLDTDLLAWWRGLSAPEPVVWTGSEDEALRAGVEEFAARADESPDAEGPDT